MKLLLSWWRTLSNLGLHDEMDAMEKLRTQLLNQCLIVGSLCNLFIFVIHLFRQHWIPELFGGILFFIFIPAFLLQKNRRFLAARLLICGTLPIFVATMIVFSGDSVPAEYFLFIVILAGLIFFKKPATQAGITLYNILCFVLAMYLTPIIDIDTGVRPTIVDLSLLFSAAALCLLAIGWLLIQEYIRYLKKERLLVSQLKLQNDDLERFAHIASHDLKTPLRNIISFSNLIEKRKKSQDELEHLQPYLDHINRSANQMHALLSDIMLFTRQGHENYMLEPVNLKVPIDIALNQLQRQFHDRKVFLNLPTTLPTVKGQANQLAVVFQNIFENAIKYNESTPPVITISTETINSKVLIRIQDNGIGIEPGFEKDVFEMFTRLHHANEYEGTGLGLAICRRILKLMDATINIAPSEKGALFILEMNPPENST